MQSDTWFKKKKRKGGAQKEAGNYPRLRMWDRAKYSLQVKVVVEVIM